MPGSNIVAGLSGWAFRDPPLRRFDIAVEPRCKPEEQRGDQRPADRQQDQSGDRFGKADTTEARAGQEGDGPAQGPQ